MRAAGEDGGGVVGGDGGGGGEGKGEKGLRKGKTERAPRSYVGLVGAKEKRGGLKTPVLRSTRLFPSRLGGFSTWKDSYEA